MPFWKLSSFLHPMFTGIIETIGKVEAAEPNGSGTTFTISSPISETLKVDQSLAHNGVCLTVEKVNGNVHFVTAVQETLQKTNMASWQAGTRVNLERCMQLGGRLDGHIVQGHVDTAADCILVKDLNGSWLYRFRYPAPFAELLIEKGSICLNGISLTAFDVTPDEFSVAIIPYTFEHTAIPDLKPGHAVNLEFDLIGKYIQRRLSLGR
jgi:riboflavin synthase